MVGTRVSQALNKGIRIALVMAIILCLPIPVRAGDDGPEAKLQMLKSQLETVNRQIEDAEKELSRIPNPNWCCCAGAFVLAPVIGGIFWYFVDIKPKQDKRRSLENRIQTLTLERQSLLAQIQALR
jgi:hypothetical protein